MRILVTLVLMITLAIVSVHAQTISPLGPNNGGMIGGSLNTAPLGPNFLNVGGAGPAPPVKCPNAAGLQYNKTCDTIYHMGIFQ